MSSNPCDPCKPKTRCDRDTKNNVWVERGCDEWSQANSPGICLLDTLDDCDIAYVLERDDRARADLLRVTSDPHLLALEAHVKRLPDPEIDETNSMDTLNANSLVLYTVFRGIPPFNQ